MRTLIHSSDEDPWHTVHVNPDCPSPPIAGLQNYATSSSLNNLDPSIKFWACCGLSDATVGEYVQLLITYSIQISGPEISHTVCRCIPFQPWHRFFVFMRRILIFLGQCTGFSSHSWDITVWLSPQSKNMKKRKHQTCSAYVNGHWSIFFFFLHTNRARVVSW